MWSIKKETYNTVHFLELLKDGWEPFCVTHIGFDYDIVWLRKQNVEN
jgi:hypothetical protein